MSELEAKRYLAKAKKILGRSWKMTLSIVWCEGSYYDHCLDSISGPLQAIRNQYGPTWLSKVSLKGVEL